MHFIQAASNEELTSIHKNLYRHWFDILTVKLMAVTASGTAIESVIKEIQSALYPILNWANIQQMAMILHI